LVGHLAAPQLVLTAAQSDACWPAADAIAYRRAAATGCSHCQRFRWLTAGALIRHALIEAYRQLAADLTLAGGEPDGRRHTHAMATGLGELVVLASRSSCADILPASDTLLFVLTVAALLLIGFIYVVAAAPLPAAGHWLNAAPALAGCCR